MLNTSSSIANPARQVAASRGMVCSTIGASFPLGLPTLPPPSLPKKGGMWKTTDTIADEVVLLMV
jgi:hypothetical protein